MLHNQLKSVIAEDMHNDGKIKVNGTRIFLTRCSSFTLQSEYQPGAAQHPFAERFRNLKGAEVKTVGEAFPTSPASSDNPSMLSTKI